MLACGPRVALEAFKREEKNASDEKGVIGFGCAMKLNRDELLNRLVVVEKGKTSVLWRCRQSFMLIHKRSVQGSNGDGDGSDDGFVIGRLKKEGADVGAKAVCSMKLEKFQ